MNHQHMPYSPEEAVSRKPEAVCGCPVWVVARLEKEMRTQPFNSTCNRMPHGTETCMGPLGAIQI